MLDPTRGPAREKIDRAEADRLRANGTLAIDNRRTRPLYFDGRFLAARDLTRDQNYFLVRQADLSRAGGTGIVAGLEVGHGSNANSIRISAGHGLTPGGESVVLPASLNVDVTQIPLIQRLNVAFGLSRIPADPIRSLTGLFVVALRPVEFTANAIASYPTSIEGPRTVEDSEVIEAAAVSLIPYPDSGGQDEMDLRRSRAAWEIFANRSTRGIPAQVLPLAMVALDRNGVHWIDPFLVRREVGAEHGNLPGLGFAPLSLREAHLQQYNSQLDEVVATRRSTNRGTRFAATEHFLTLPPAGRMPSACINPADFTQSFFPPTVDLDLAIIPDDELPILVEESLRLPPFDLTLTNDDLDSTAVVALIPVPRADLQRLKNSLTTLTRVIRPSVPGLLAQRKPLEILQTLKLPRVPAPIVVNPADEAWRQALSAVDFLWYVRRRALPYRADLTGTVTAIEGSTPVPITGDVLRPGNITTRIGGLGGVIR